MVTKQTIQGYVKAEPFRPFRLHLVNGRTFDIHHPELIELLQSALLVFKVATGSQELTDEWDTASMTLVESISPLEAPVH